MSIITLNFVLNLKNKTTMKKLLLLVTILITVNANSQSIKIEPMFKVGLYCGGRSEAIVDNNNNIIQNYLGKDSYYNLEQKINKSMEYYITGGIRFDIEYLKVEFVTKTYIITDDFVSNSPYMAEYYFRIYRDIGTKMRFGIEHECTHPILSEKYNVMYNKRGGYTEIFFSYNMW